MKARLVFLLAMAALSLAAAKDWPPGRDVGYDSLPPNVRYYYELKAHPELKRRSFDDPESLNCRLVGKWGRGPAVKVTGRDSWVFLSLGSEVAVFNAADGSNPRIVTEIQCRGIVSRSILKDSLLYAVQRGALEVFNIRDIAHPVRVSYFRRSMIDMAIEDSLAYVIDDESLWVCSIAQPGELRRLGACRDSGYSIFADSGFAYVCDRWGLYIIDCTDPARPRRASTLGGEAAEAAWVEDGYCYYTHELPSSAFRIADVSDPYHPSEVGHRDDLFGYDVYKIDYFVYLPGYQIVDVSLPSSPAIIGSVTPGGIGVWTRSPFSFSFIAAGYNGLRTVNIDDPVRPFVDTAVAQADYSYDVSVIDGHAYVANYYDGMKVLSVSTPQRPLEIGSYDTTEQAPKAYCVLVVDSYAYLGTQSWGPTGFRVLDVRQPSNPILVAALEAISFARAIAVRDSLAYFAMDGFLNVISIANPRAPRLVGSCGLPNASACVWLTDTLAYVSQWIVSIKDPAHPAVVGSFGVWAYGICVRDTIAYLAASLNGFQTWSVADPTAPYPISRLDLDGACMDVVLRGNKAFVGTKKLEAVDISDPAAMRQVGFYDVPRRVVRLRMQDSLIFAACWEGGVCIFAEIPVGIAERPTRLRTDAQLGVRLDANPVRSRVELNLSGLVPGPVRVGFFDVAGREVKTLEFMATRQSGRVSTTLNLTDLPRGVLLLTARQGNRARTLKLIRP